MELTMKLFNSFLILILFLFTLSLFGANENPEEIFVEANRHYSNNDFITSLSLYNELLKKGIKNGSIYYNIGNCNYRLNKIGEAILNYKRALVYTPRDQDLKANLEQARSLTKDYIESSQYEGLKTKLIFWHNYFNKKETLIILLIVNLIFFILLSIRLFKNVESLNYALVVSFLLLTMFFLSFIAKQFFKTSDGVVLEKVIEIKSSMNIDSTTLFSLHEGAEFEVEETENEWLKIRLIDNKKGWVKKEYVGLTGE